jgi:hypothetical protein
VNYLVTERIENIVPMLTEAVRSLSPTDKAMKAVRTEQL